MRAALALALVLTACNPCNRSPRGPSAPTCALYENLGTDGPLALKVEKIATGLEVPWSIAFLPNGDAWIAERPGRVRALREGKLTPPIATLTVSTESEAGLLGLAIDPGFAQNRRFFVYYTRKENDNRVERWIASEDLATAKLDRVIVEGIAAAKYHDGGRMRIGPDSMLWIATGDAREPERAQKLESLNGKLLRVTLDGAPAEGNPWPGNRAVLTGIRNLQAFDFIDGRTIALADHGPSGELGRRGHDEISIAKLGDNLGWPTIWGCETHPGMVPPLVAFKDAVPPGGGIIVRGDAIAAWKGSFVVASLGARSLHRFALDGTTISGHEVYLREKYGRLREVANAPDGSLWVTTSNCDGRGDCGEEKDLILRLRM